jgi:Cu-Zn family superoxide dismutase
MRTMAILAISLFLAACASTPDLPPPGPPREAWIVDAQGARIGQARFAEGPAGVLIHMEFSAGALPPGWHGLHIHQVGICSDPADGFRASGAHMGHDSATAHGLLNRRGPEAGDLPNLFAPAAGPFAAEVFSPWLTLAPEGGEGRLSLLDADGAALVIHAGADDQTTQPIGGAGARIGCAALTRTP